MEDTELMKQLRDSEPTNQRIYRGTQRKLQLLADRERRTTPQYLAVLIDREYDRLTKEVK